MNKRIPIFIGLFVLIFALWAQITSVSSIKHIVSQLELFAYDLQVRAQFLTLKAKPIQTRIAIIDIDDKSLGTEGRWPWSRAKIADLTQRLQEYGAAVIAFDIMFSEKEENIVEVLSTVAKNKKLSLPQIDRLLDKVKPFFDNDAQLAKAFTKGDTVLGMSFLPRNFKSGILPNPTLTLKTTYEKNLRIIDTKGYLSPIQTLQKAANHSGFINVLPDEDGIIRRAPILLRYQDNLYPSLALEAVRVFLFAKIKIMTANYGNQQEIEGVMLGDHLIPTNQEALAMIPFRGKSFTFPYFSATDVLNKKIPIDALQGKIVFIGTSATGLGDLVPTAIQSPFPGVEVQASIADGILSNSFSYSPAWAVGAELFITALIGSICVFLFPFFGPRILSLLILLIPILLIFLNNLFLRKTGILLSILVPAAFIILLGILNMIYGYLFETRRREHLKEMFGQYVPAKHIDAMLHSSSNYGLYGEEREMTVLFADIRHFTMISETLAASQLKQMLSEFFTPMTEIIFKYQGTIDKYVGDMIMAFWGAPLKDKKHAQHAITAALEMQQAVKKLQPYLAEHGWPKIQIGIGLNTGMMSVGDMGSKYRRNYTVIGDSVNLASRSESLTKFYGASIIVTENTYRNQRNFVFQQLDRVRVKGKLTGIAIYRVVCKRGHASAKKLHELKLSDTALNHYFNQDWDQAFKIFKELHAIYPRRKLYSIYLKRIKAFKKMPPQEDWDGVFTHLSK